MSAEEQRASVEKLAGLLLPDLKGMLAAQVQMLAAVGSHRPLQESLDPLVAFIESLLPDVLGSILLADAASRTLRSVAAPRLPEDLARSLVDVPIAEGACTCGTAAFRGELVVTERIELDPGCGPYPEYRRLTQAYGLRACWSMPFRDAGGAIAGTFAMYRKDPSVPTPTQVQLLRFAGAVAGLVVDRHRDTLALRDSEERYRRLTELSPDGVIVHRRGTILYANRAFGRFVDGRGAAAPVGRRLEEFFAAVDPGELAELQLGLLSLRLRGPAGRLLEVEVSAAPITVFGDDATMLMVRDVSERRDLEQALADAAEQERMRLSLDLHDGLGQQLTGASLLLAGVARQLAGAPEDLREEVARVQRVLRDSIDEARALANAMAPVEVERDGLAGALRELANRIERAHGVAVDLQVEPGVEALLSRDVSAQLFRIAQEAVSNAARHSGCRNIDIRLRRPDGHIELVVTDDGEGFAVRDAAQSGLGLRGMRYRASRIGATFRVEPTPTAGTRVMVRWAVPGERDA